MTESRRTLTETEYNEFRWFVAHKHEIVQSMQTTRRIETMGWISSIVLATAVSLATIAGGFVSVLLLKGSK